MHHRHKRQTQREKRERDKEGGERESFQCLSEYLQKVAFKKKYAQIMHGDKLLI